MRLSIFPKTNPLPKGKEEKNKAAKTAIQPVVVEIESDQVLIETVTSYCWSPFVFKGNRKQDNFVSTDWAVLDIDSNLTLEEAEKIISEAGFTCLALPTTSHTPDAHRFRLVLPLSRTITNTEDYVATMEDLRLAFPMADSSCVTDWSRLYFSSTNDDGFWIEGDLLEPVKAPVKPKKGATRQFDPSKKVRVEGDIKELIKELYGEDRESVPEVVDFFLKNCSTGLEGNWITTINSFVFTLSLQSVELDVIYDLILYLAPRGELTKRDEDTIERAYKDGAEARDNNET